MRTFSDTAAVAVLCRVKHTLMKPSGSAQHHTAPLPMLVIHCSPLTKTISTSLSQELVTKPRTFLPWNASGG